MRLNLNLGDALGSGGARSLLVILLILAVCHCSLPESCSPLVGKRSDGLKPAAALVFNFGAFKSLRGNEGRKTEIKLSETTEKSNFSSSS